jgi:predicted Ser/Thr protein kinase
MTPERWRRIEEVYQYARDRPPDGRGAYIKETCGDDQDLRREVEFLLEHDNSSPDMILNRPAWLGFGRLDETLEQPAPGTRLGPYEIECPLGAGGMGAVFRGRDIRLNRPVAIKLLRAQFNDRLEREARAISALAHPHICTLYDIGANFLVMEFLEGETLASRLTKGPLPVEVARRYGAQIASGMAAAHAKGLVHRDLKPTNIMLTSTGIKVLDFGLAKGADDENLTQGILGTPAYMSPEQKAGKPCDSRTDIYALGLILREMAAGNGGQVVSTLGTTQFTQLVDCCLREDPEARWQSASDLAKALEWLREAPSDRASPRRPPGSFALWACAAAVLIFGIFGLAARVWRRTADRTFTPSVARLALPITSKGLPSDPGQLSGPPAISPDGKVVVLSLTTNGRSSLWMRPLDSDRLDRLEGTDGAAQPFWSPDGARIAFFAGGKIKKMRMPHGTPEILGETPTETARGGAWSSKGVILFGVNYKGLMKISGDGGDPVVVARLDEHLKENSLRFPQFLADGNRFIYFSRSSDPRNRAVYLDALDTLGKVPRKKLTMSEGPSELGHDPTSNRDFLVFPMDGQLWAQRFDGNSGLLAGEKLAISEDVEQFSLSTTGTLVYRRATSEQSTLTWRDRAGNSAGQAGESGDYWDVSLSPDERFAAVVNHRSRDGRFWVDMIDLGRDLQSRFSDPGVRASGLVWARDSGSLYLTSWGEKEAKVLSRRIDSTAPAQTVISSSDHYDVRSLGADGRTLAADHWIGTTEHGLGFALGGQLPWRVFELPPVVFKRCQFSANGKWLLFQSNESGAFEIYLSDFPGLSIRRRLSVSGGAEPRWGRDGKEIFYVAPDRRLMSAAIEDPVHMVFARARALFRLPVQLQPEGGFSYDVSRDARRFLVLDTTPPLDARELSVVFNWPQLMGGDAQL